MDKQNNRYRVLEWSFFGLLAAACLILSIQFRGGDGPDPFMKELKADPGGYYIYLPSLFYFGFDASKCPEKLDEKTGFGFTLDKETRKIRTKYFCGEALLLLPFFTVAASISWGLGIASQQGFSPVFHHAMILAAVFYLVAGLWILKRALERYLKGITPYFVIFFILAGTNLFYYSLSEGLMSHVYSFFLFSLFLYSMIRHYSEGSYRWFLVAAFSASLAVLIRPTALLLAVVFTFWDVRSFREIPGRLLRLARPAFSLVFLLILVIVYLPQLLYWRYLSGSFFYDPYPYEGFTHMRDPYIIESWFSPLNGLFMYSPMVLLFVAGIAGMVLKKKTNGWLFLLLFLFIAYLFSSWYSWFYGCGFGQRSYIEYYALFSIPFGILTEAILKKKNLFLRSLFVLLLILLAYAGLRLSLFRILSGDRCFSGSTWDWYKYGQQLQNAGLYNPGYNHTVFTNDFENNAINAAEKRTEFIARSGFNSIRFDPSTGYGAFYRVRLKEAGYPLLKTVKADIHLLSTNPLPTGAILVCSIEKEGKSLLWQGVKADSFSHESGKWFGVSGNFLLLDGLDPSAYLFLYVWNAREKGFFADDLRVEIK